MQRRLAVTLLSIPILVAVTALAGCGSKDKGTNPTPVTEPFESGTLGTTAPGNVFVHIFNTAGSFSYRCRIHPTMVSTITVQAGGADSVLLTIRDFSFDPAAPVKVGGYVKWTNIGPSGHTVSR